MVFCPPGGPPGGGGGVAKIESPFCKGFSLSHYKKCTLFFYVVLLALFEARLRPCTLLRFSSCRYQAHNKTYLEQVQSARSPSDGTKWVKKLSYRCEFQRYYLLRDTVEITYPTQVENPRKRGKMTLYSPGRQQDDSNAY